MAKQIFVFIDLAGKSHFTGRLWLHERSGIGKASFEYSKEWRSSPSSFSLEPALTLGKGAYHINKPFFGSIEDSAPDRWGRSLMERKEAQKAKAENRKARKLKESDYLLMVDDRTRLGALRFSTVFNGPYLASSSSLPIPPLINLKRLLNASGRVMDHREREQDLKDIVEPGSSLGGARPKAVIKDNNDKLMIAKFPSPKDEWDVELWELISLRMAKKAGIDVSNFFLEKVSKKNILLLYRFDRHGKKVRVPFLSGMSMLGALDGETRSYLELAESLIEYGCHTEKDLIELWRRIVFNILISNVDDHLRNHGFLYDTMALGWHLSPIFDLEPTPEHVKERFLRTNIDFSNNMASLELAFEVAEDFGLKPYEAKSIAKKVADSVKMWNKEAYQFGISRQEIEFMSSAFEHDDLKLALKGN